ncbi:MAG: CPBP family intramembrane metalloprotease [Streptococcaceae bacterium]|jgi:membrane protease YdiL (CAAX protease family)|nr:CPBP family intramembrane metalloprotease [Streptococcaceae bacterium]
MNIYRRNEWLTLAIIPAELLIGNLLISPLLKGRETAFSVTNVLLFLFGFLAVILLNRHFLAEQWQIFRKRFWLKLLLAILFVVIAQILLTLVRDGLGLNAVKADKLSMLEVFGSLFWSMIPALLAPFTEEIVFRHLLFMKFRASAKPAIFWCLWLLQSLLFGLIHWVNFNGQILQMVPYMVIGAYFGLIYYFSKNIWQSILTHFIFNGMSLFMLIFSLIMSLFS